MGPPMALLAERSGRGNPVGARRGSSPSHPAARHALVGCLNRPDRQDRPAPTANVTRVTRPPANGTRETTNGTRATGTRAIFLLVLALLTAPPARASDPPASAVTAPTKPGETVKTTWSGQIPPGANLDSSCVDAPADDRPEVTLTVPAGLYDTLNVQAAFTIAGAGAADTIVTVLGPGGTSVSSDGTSVGGEEKVTMANPKPGTYTVVACAW